MAKADAVDKLAQRVKETPAEMATREEAEAEREAELEKSRIEGEGRIQASFADAQKLLKQTKDLEEEDFETIEDDFWKPEKPGDFIQGVYLGTIDDRYKTHCFGTVDKEGNPLMKRMNGSRGVSSSLSRLAPNKYIVRVTFQGQEKTGAGRNVNKWDVGVKPIKGA